MSPGRLFVVLCGVVVCASGVGCGAGAVVDLGDARPPPYRFGTPRLLAELDVGFSNENPALTADLLELYYNSNHGDGEGELWSARRDSVGAPFAAGAPVAEVNSPMFDANPAISPDGLWLYFASDRAGGAGEFDIWRTSRATRTTPWAAPENLPALNSAAKDIPRPPGQHGLVLPLASQRDTPDGYQIYLSARPSLADPFGAPVVVSELTIAGYNVGDAFLSDDGLTLFYASSPVGANPDLFVAWRKTTSQPFTVTAPLADLNTDGDERDPWLSPDGTLLYFVSDRGGVLQIYEAPATRAPL